jgi:hypothetical protein
MPQVQYFKDVFSLLQAKEEMRKKGIPFDYVLETVQKRVYGGEEREEGTGMYYFMREIGDHKFDIGCYCLNAIQVWDTMPRLWHPEVLEHSRLV